MEWTVVYEKYCKAVSVVVSAIEPFLNYGVSCTTEMPENKSFIYVGFDKEINDGFKIKVHEPEGDLQRIDIFAPDEINLLYAAYDFKNKYIPYARYSNTHQMPYYFNDIFNEPLKVYEYASSPRIKDRGIWTWGYVIYDYRKFIDNMVSIKLNTLIIWNDFLPANISEVISYAHENGIKIYLGFAWGWDTKLIDVARADELIPDIINTFETQYANIGCDGIYFQSFTEINSSVVNGISIAEAVTEFVNKIGGEILEKHKDFKLLFGLHAMSVRDRLDAIKNVDDRISIIWEDAGAFPYAYTPYAVEGFDETVNFTRKIRDLRNGGFGTVLKGVICLDWDTFKHQNGEFILGEADKKFIKNRTEEKRDILRYVQAYWIKNAKYAHEMIKEFKSDTMVTVLAEDGMFEEKLNYPMAIYAEMMWDSEQSTDDILCTTALRPDVEFV